MKLTPLQTNAARFRCALLRELHRIRGRSGSGYYEGMRIGTIDALKSFDAIFAGKAFRGIVKESSQRYRRETRDQAVYARLLAANAGDMDATRPQYIAYLRSGEAA